MKRHATIFIITLAMAYGAFGSMEVQILSKAPPEQTIIDVVGSKTGTVNVQTRNRGAGGVDYRAIAQSFQWNSDQKLNGIGIRIRSTQSEYPWPKDAAQLYVLHIETGEGARLSGKTAVRTYTFSIPGDLIGESGEKYLYISGLDLDLKKGKWYGFQFGPEENSVDLNLRIFFEASDTAFPGHSVHSRQVVPADIDYVENYGKSKDVSFFATVGVSDGQ